MMLRHLSLRITIVALTTVCITIAGLIVLLLRKCNMLEKCNKSRVLDEVSESSGIAGVEEN